MNKFLSAVIACTLAASMLTTPAFAASQQYKLSPTVLSGDDEYTVYEKDNLQYQIIDKEAVIVGSTGDV